MPNFVEVLEPYIEPGKVSVKKLVAEFVASNIFIAEVTVFGQHDNLRMNIASYIKYHKIPIKVWAKSGKMYIERTDKTKEELNEIRRTESTNARY